jgi:hypothetical protein
MTLVKRFGLVAILLVALVAAACEPFEDGAWVDPSTTGHNTPIRQLRVIDGPEDTVPCARWTPTSGVFPGYLTVTCPTTLQKLWIKGGVYDESGNLTVRYTVIAGGGAWFILTMSRGGTLVVEDSTLQWKRAGTNPNVGNGSGAIQVSGTTNMTVRRSNLSGNPDGIQASGTTLIEDTYIHNLAQVGTYPNNTHNDGIQFYSGTLTIRRSYFDTGAKSPYSNAAVFLQGGGIGAVRIENTYLNGGGYTLYAQNGSVSLSGVVFGPDHLWGERR